MESLRIAMAEIEPLAQELDPVYMPLEFATGRVLPAVVATAAFTTILYVAAFPLVSNRLIPGDASDKEVLRKRRQLSYMTTNCITNLIIGLLGCYYEYGFLPQNPTMADRVQGCDDWYIFSAIQIGFQVWSIFMGTFFVEEQMTMIFHHMGCICVASMCCFLHNGYRYWTSYYFGVYELSSVPLAFMNAFKHNKEWITQYPDLYLAIRMIFAVVFLTVRIVMLLFRMPYVRDVNLFPYLMTNEHWFLRCFMFAVGASSTWLCSLQYYWGYLVITGIYKQFFVKKRKADSKKDQ
ncbi:expressed unknown protein [Seminavis robusta]|uniref:TLC domain-containing protein n=1 Tax=Seminavis robusta TaxID=568900 RepID=A0A9N8H478_9STRA|nr:expressed unknown protein [Seminavis robusta]|eukprot:Sro78_g042510.1 n/a (293) ;mRNA; f:82918-83796